MIEHFAHRRAATTCRLALATALAALYVGCKAGSVGVGGGPISDRVVVLYANESSESDTGHVVYAVVLRGRPGWQGPGASSGVNAGTLFGFLTHSTQTYTTGTVRIEITFSRLQGTLQVAGGTIRLSEGNVVLVDSVDTGGNRLPVRSAGRFDLPVPPGQGIGPFLLEHNAAARAFATGA
jgi:hypothetical protein